jgi:UDP-N-acetylmuramoyl-tripeptide--D-alanyl-D-alanine ligase
MMTLAQAAAGIQALAVHGDATFHRVVIDSRQVAPGDLFVALRGENFDGHDFIDAVFAAGAAAVMVDKDYAKPVTGLVVENTEKALGLLGEYWRNQQDVKVLALTGSSGKTTVKEMLSSILRHQFGAEKVLATQGNLNNHLGVPLTLLSLKPEHQFAVVEMGMNHLGEIRYLTHLAHPDVALINNAQEAHLEMLGSVAGVAKAKAEIYEGLGENGVAIINQDDPQHALWQQTPHPQLFFGLSAGDVYAKNVELSILGSTFTLVLPTGEAVVTLSAPGEHNVRNALAAAAMAYTQGLSAADIAAGLATFVGVKGRLFQQKAFNGAMVIDDTYNANPASMRAAIDVLARFSSPKILVLGDFGEIGEDGKAWHQKIGAYAKEQNIDMLFALGESMAFAVEVFGGRHFASAEALVAALREVMTPETTVLIKGSRFMKMERIVAGLQESTAC